MMGSMTGRPAPRNGYAGRLSGYGPAEEVWEIAQELECEDRAFAAKFVEKAFAGGVRFTPEQVLEMTDTVDKSLLGKIGRADRCALRPGPAGGDLSADR